MANSVAYGFVGQEHLWSQRVTQLGDRVLLDAINESAAEHTRAINAMLAGLAERTPDRTRRILLASAGTLQPLDEWGNPLPVKPEGYYNVGFPIQGGGTAWGDNRVSRALMTVEEANRNTLDALAKDRDWVERHMLAAILDNASWTYPDPQGDVTVQPLANGDSVIYNRVGGAASSDDHYLATADAIADATNPFPALYDELAEHPSNRGPFVVYVPTNLADSVEGLTGFVEVGDPDIALGANSDTISGTIDRGFGDEVLGKVNRFWVIEWKALPDSYMVAHARGAGTPLAMREYPEAALQGLFTEFNDVDGNLMETRMIRYAGYGVQDRVAVAVQRIGNASYAVPTGYDAPLAV